jgi:hypothetical protein
METYWLTYITDAEVAVFGIIFKFTFGLKYANRAL